MTYLISIKVAQNLNKTILRDRRFIYFHLCEKMPNICDSDGIKLPCSKCLCYAKNFEKLMDIKNIDFKVVEL